MEGIIDVVYERRGRLYLADYKTDRTDRAEVAEAAERYRQQAEIYTRAATQALKRKVTAFKLIFLRLGAAVEIRTSEIQGELFT
jgi:ATP-dependent exoDNAse (exonuclease V) beta subunit